MSAINFAVIGYGGMGAYHVHNILPNENERIHIVGTYDINEERQAISQEKGHKIFKSYDEVLADETIEAVLIATPNDLHKELSIAALKAGKHVVCEKPVALNTAELDEIVAVAQETGNTFMVHQNRRWDPDFLLVRELYRNGQIGDLFQLESRVQGANGIPGDWRHVKKQGGGMLLDWGVHLLDQMLWLIDSPVKDVKADLSFVLGEEVDDGFFALITFENGVKAIVEVGTSNYTQLPRWYIKGTEGTATITDWDLNGEMVQATGREDVAAPKPVQAGVGLTKTMAPPSELAAKEIPFPKGEADFEPFYKNFYNVVRNGAEPIVKNEEVRAVMQLIERIFATA
ncbi:gfo/Idh/MocA family oxidoreductase [Enterococcus casseliflavus]|uniref:Gfo/Idh/MocA family protein n=1 Tax=Enterococcus casseliflavus TaxID=37734 RepID=UPI000F4EB931|nr:Gfo/Idh/MocA family oxidoreductase [Enterococcus casseliflavus]ROY46220.1 gfo/Idh/MocA family oxidoreductase [Enterococcus casseliflavus]